MKTIFSGLCITLLTFAVTCIGMNQDSKKDAAFPSTISLLGSNSVHQNYIQSADFSNTPSNMPITVSLNINNDGASVNHHLPAQQDLHAAITDYYALYDQTSLNNNHLSASFNDLNKPVVDKVVQKAINKSGNLQVQEILDNRVVLDKALTDLTFQHGVECTLFRNEQLNAAALYNKEITAITSRGLDYHETTKLLEQLMPYEFYQKAIQRLANIKNLEIAIAVHQKLLQHNQELLAKFEITIVTTVSKHIEGKPLCDIASESQNVQADIAKLEISLADALQQEQKLLTKIEAVNNKIKNINFFPWALSKMGIKTSSLKNLLAIKKNLSIELNEFTKKGFSYKNDLAQKDVELRYLQEHLEKFMQQQRIELKNVQKILSELNQQGNLSKDDQDLLHAVNLALFDEGAYCYKASNKLTQGAEAFLRKLGIDPEKFRSMDAANALQKHLFEDVGNKINDLAELRTEHKDNAHVMEYVDAAAFSYDATVDMIKTGNPQQAIVMDKVGSALHDAANVAIGVAKGIKNGLVVNVLEALERGLLPQPIKLGKDLVQMFSLIADVARTENKLEAFNQVFDGFQQLPLEQQVEQVVSVLTIFLLPTPGKLNAGIASVNKVLNQITKVAKMEMAGLKALHAVENAPFTVAHVFPTHEITAPFSTSLVRAAIEHQPFGLGNKLNDLAGASSSPFNFAGQAIEVVEATKDWWKAYNNTWSGNTIKFFDAQKLNMQKIETHLFTPAHMKAGLEKLGNTKQEIFDKIVKAIRDADAKNLLKNGLTNKGMTNQIQTAIDGHLIEIRVHITNGNAMFVDAFAGHGVRTNIGHLVKF
ncbi:MAG: hypothetical protein P4L31_08775 [Candidatus Babeliales bacterium]|nr:hypothetical protein [Candidatus Babeliales bacterium]